MRKFLLTVCCLGMFGSAFGQSKLDLKSLMELNKLRNTSIPTYNARTRSLEQPKTTPTNIMAMVELKDQNNRADLEAQGIKVLRVRDNIAIALIPLADVERIANLKCVRRMQLPRRLYQKMNLVRKEVGVDKIHQGTDLPQAYTGKGVVTAVVDGGVDPNHINFFKEDGTSRFAYVGKIVENKRNKNGYQYDKYYPRTVLDTMTQANNAHALETFKTDNDESVHGTHTLGIMAGGYKGNITYGEAVGTYQAKSVTGANPFYGSATESELIASCGDLNDSYIALGIDDAIEYAKTSGPSPKPCVINLSLGSNIGVHDSTSVMNKYLSKQGKEAIICVAAGNEGEKPIALKKTFDTAGETVKTFLTPMDISPVDEGGTTYYNFRNGQIAAYSKDSTVFEFYINVVDTKQDNRTILSIAVPNNLNGRDVTYASKAKYVNNSNDVNKDFAKAFEGYVSVSSAIDSETNCYYAFAEVMTGDNQTTNQDEDYKLTLEIKSKKAGQSVEVYTDDQNIYFDDNDEDGFVKGSANGSISDMACATNIITVGSYNVRNRIASLDGSIYNFNGLSSGESFPIGEISSFSSFGTLGDGRNLPHVCAPGAAVISSVNTYAVKNKDLDYEDDQLQGKLKKGKDTYYWHQSIGTSMATPVVAGGVALWLEANPSLTVKDVLRIIQQTAKKDDFVKTTGDPVQWGAGKFDAYEGLKQVLKEKQTNGINGVRTTESKDAPIITKAGDRTFNLFLAGAKQLNVRVFTPSGQLVHSLSAQGNEYNLNASSWNKGVYLIQVNGNKAQRIIIY